MPFKRTEVCVDTGIHRTVVTRDLKGFFFHDKKEEKVTEVNGNSIVY